LEKKRKNIDTTFRRSSGSNLANYDSTMNRRGRIRTWSAHVSNCVVLQFYL